MATPVVLPQQQYVPEAGHGCHALLAQASTDAEVLRARLNAVHPAYRLWETAVPGRRTADTARRRVCRELLRPVPAGRVPLRAVLLRYPDGTADLLLVARRTAVPALGELADTMLTGAAPPAGPAGTEPADARPPARAEVPWGLGDPRRAGTLTARPLHLPAGLAADALHAALALTVARYEGARSVLLGRLDGAEGTVLRMTIDPDGAVSATRDSTQAPPVAGVAVTAAGDGRCYLPALIPPWPVTVQLAVTPSGDTTATCWFDAGTLDAAVAGDFCALLSRYAAALAAGEPPDAVPALDAARAAEVLRLGGAGTPVPDGRRIDRIERLLGVVAARQPDAVAVTDGHGELTYGELTARAAALAAGLRDAGLRRGDLVGVCLPRDRTLIVSLLAVLTAGCTYVPMDENYPAERLRYITTDAGLRAVLGDPARFPAEPGVRVLDPAAVPAQNAPADAGSPAAADPAADREAGADEPAYVIYTSGSTGRPKGVVVPHRNAAALIAATAADFGLGNDDVWTMFHSSAFDFSVWEIWGCLLTGGRLVVVGHDTARDATGFRRLLRENRVTVLSQTPSAFSVLDRTDRGHQPRLAVRLLIFGGEPLDPRVLAGWFTRYPPAHCRVVNMFGITETTVHVTARTVTAADAVIGSRSVGHALPGWSVSVRDEQGALLPPGAAGEIHVAGAGVAIGYLHKPELTDRRFSTGQGVRAYRSGDRGRLHPDGTLDHLGRLDSQVKLRGYRIELDEIRAVLVRDLGAQDAVVTVHRATPGDSATDRIDAYVVLDQQLSAAELLAGARRILPDYMVPATVTVIDEIPLTANGKTDLDRLPPPGSTAPAPGSDDNRSDGATRDELERDILQVWSHCLRAEVTVADNFFTLGGNSLLVERLLAELRDRRLPPMTARDLYRNSTAGGFIALARQRQAAGST